MESIQIERSIGVQLNFGNDTKFPPDLAWKFLKKNGNKRVLHPYLLDKILEKAY